ncbi:MAG: hypothetical protein A2Z34_09760 [Planctomycetes bacterium RBG_16_59_8]|nr:MAG: hypothetical protein A2Z34_09760 [Planctomycetes bacterium RBG_16_59_8]
MKRRFYAANVTLGPVILGEREAHHARDVLRLQNNDPVLLFDGKGTIGEGVLSEVNKDRVACRVESLSSEKKRDRSIAIAVAFPKGARSAFMVEKCAELGIERLIPLICERTVTVPSKSKIERHRRIAQEAARQSRQGSAMAITEPGTLADILKKSAEWGTIVLAAPGAVSENRGTGWGERGSTLILVGPEGGFTEKEVTTIRNAGATEHHLGEQILRTETAAIALAATAYLIGHQ